MLEEIDNPIVSFVVTCHNKARYIEPCLNSIVAQNYRPLEVVVCENGSKDGSKAIVEKFEKYPFFKCVYHPEKMGLAKAFNTALKKVSGDWVIKLDGDDVDKPNHVQLLIKEARKNPNADMLFGDLEEIDSKGNVIAQISGYGGLENIFHRCSIAHATALIKKDIYDELGGYDEKVKFSDDWELMIRIVKAGKKCLYVGETGHQWRRAYDSKSLTSIFKVNSEERKRDHSYIFRKHGLDGPCECGCGAMP